MVPASFFFIRRRKSSKGPSCPWSYGSTGPPVSSTNKTDRHDISEILVESGVKHHKTNKKRGWCEDVISGNTNNTSMIMANHHLSQPPSSHSSKRVAYHIFNPNIHSYQFEIDHIKQFLSCLFQFSIVLFNLCEDNNRFYLAGMCKLQSLSIVCWVLRQWLCTFGRRVSD